jgi:predicted MFS family arabinose efflux permease
VHFDVFEGVKNIAKALKVPRIKTLYLIYFLFMFGWNLLLQFVPVHLVKQFSFSSSDIGDAAAFMGICWALGSALVNKYLMKRFCQMKVLELCLILIAGLFFSILFVRNLHLFFLIIGLSVVLAGLSWPICTSLISGLAGKQIQGKILGISQSMQSLAMALSPGVGGFIEPLFLGAPFLVGAITSLIAALLYFKVRKSDRNRKLQR